MGAVSTELTIASDPMEFVKGMKESLASSYASGDLTSMSFLQDANDERHLSVTLQWKDLATAKRNFEQVETAIGSVAGAANLVERSQLKLKSRIGPDIEIG
jgi:hypothetical protein